jgi:hypothetical protein
MLEKLYLYILQVLDPAEKILEKLYLYILKFQDQLWWMPSYWREQRWRDSPQVLDPEGKMLEKLYLYILKFQGQLL